MVEKGGIDEADLELLAKSDVFVHSEK